MFLCEILHFLLAASKCSRKLHHVPFQNPGMNKYIYPIINGYVFLFLLNDFHIILCNVFYLKYVHYANTPMQYTAIFHGCKNVHFQMKIFNIFLIFAQNIDCGYFIEAVLTSTHNLCFGAKIRNQRMVL